MPDNSPKNTTPAIPVKPAPEKYDKEVEIAIRLGARCAIVSAFLYGRLTEFEIYDYE